MKILYSSIRQDKPSAYYIPNGLEVGKQFILRGRVGKETTSFAINLQEDDVPGKGEIAFHFNPRPNGGVCVRNSFQGSWGGEEREQPNFPFSEGQFFTLRIEVGPDGYRTYVYGKHYITFQHRLDMKKVKFLYLTEGVEYYDVSVQDPFSLPYKTEIPGHMKVGKAIRVRGAAQDNEGFSMNFAGDKDNRTCIFHFNPRPKDNVVVRNANLGGWGQEERDYSGEFPFKPAEYFDTLFIAGEDRYYVYVNDKFFVDFKHRKNLNDVTHFVISGNMDIMDVEYLESLDLNLFNDTSDPRILKPQSYQERENDGNFVKRIPSGLQKGDVITFSGFMKPGGNTFSINFRNGFETSDDIAFHFNPRLNQNEVVMNAHMGGNWGEEDKFRLPEAFAKKEPFDMKFVTKRKKFKVYVNGKSVTEFKARSEVGDIKGVNVFGDAYIFQVKFQRTQAQPEWEKIPGGLREGSWTVVKGLPKKNSDGFGVNFRCDDKDSSDIALHFNPRFSAGCTVMNTFEGGSWGQEERVQKFPFQPKDDFVIAINVKADRFVTYVNWKHYADFRHRLSFDKVCHLQMSGNAKFLEPDFM